MKLAFVEMCGFRGYKDKIRIEFADRFTIIDGRNGVGKSTVFDAVEYALTGVLGKYGKIKSDGESVADYVWWRGDEPPPVDRYVEVGFSNNKEPIVLRRSLSQSPDRGTLTRLQELMSDTRIAPPDSLVQACAASIIRDEQITELSLDLKETDRYSLFRNALGANDSALWVTRSEKVLAIAVSHHKAAQQDFGTISGEVSAAARRMDEVRANMVSESVLADAVARLQAFTESKAAPDQLLGPVRERIAAREAIQKTFRDVLARKVNMEAERQRIRALEVTLDLATTQSGAATAEFEKLKPIEGSPPASLLSADARALIVLVAQGRNIGLRDGHCPLCTAGRTQAEFEEGLAATERLAKSIDEFAAATAAREAARQKAEALLVSAKQAVQNAQLALNAVREQVRAFDLQLTTLGFSAGTSIDEIGAEATKSEAVLEAAYKDLRILETLRLSGELERAQRAQAEAKERLTRIQERLGRARKAESSARALHDAARRAAAETLDLRLERVLPLLSELYRRLRPHPVWSEIEYAIRGDVMRFMKLQVGEDLNPQFLFSSGQRRATGLAFLLSVNLSLAWSRWRSILLDDPVQHIDDFRAVHLAEIVAQLVWEGRQIILSVEDEALADLLCRRLPVEDADAARRITLGVNAEGLLAKVADRLLVPLVKRSLVGSPLGVSEQGVA